MQQLKAPASRICKVSAKNNNKRPSMIFLTKISHYWFTCILKWYIFNDFYVKNPPDDILENRLQWCWGEISNPQQNNSIHWFEGPLITSDNTVLTFINLLHAHGNLKHENLGWGSQDQLGNWAISFHFQCSEKMEKPKIKSPNSMTPIHKYFIPSVFPTDYIIKCCIWARVSIIIEF